MNAPQSATLTLLLGSGNKVFVYEGFWEEAKKGSGIAATGYHVQNGLGKFIRLKQQQLQQSGQQKEALMLLIKPSEQATYRNVIDALDEVLINGVARYALVSPEQEEAAFLQAN